MIGQPLADNAANGNERALVIIHSGRNPVRVTEIEFCQIAVQMLLATMLVDPAHAALEDRKEALDRVRVCIAPDVLTNAVQHPLMRGEFTTDRYPHHHRPAAGDMDTRPLVETIRQLLCRTHEREDQIAGRLDSIARHCFANMFNPFSNCDFSSHQCLCGRGCRSGGDHIKADRPLEALAVSEA